MILRIITGLVLSAAAIVSSVATTIGYFTKTPCQKTSKHMTYYHCKSKTMFCSINAIYLSSAFVFALLMREETDGLLLSIATFVSEICITTLVLFKVKVIPISIRHEPIWYEYMEKCSNGMYVGYIISVPLAYVFLRDILFYVQMGGSAVIQAICLKLFLSPIERIRQQENNMAMRNTQASRQCRIGSITKSKLPCHRVKSIPSNNHLLIEYYLLTCICLLFSAASMYTYQKGYDDWYLISRNMYQVSQFVSVLIITRHAWKRKVVSQDHSAQVSSKRIVNRQRVESRQIPSIFSRGRQDMNLSRKQMSIYKITSSKDTKEVQGVPRENRQTKLFDTKISLHTPSNNEMDIMDIYLYERYSLVNYEWDVGLATFTSVPIYRMTILTSTRRSKSVDVGVLSLNTSIASRPLKNATTPI